MKQSSLALILIIILAVILAGGYLVSETSPKTDGCRPTGCSGQICSDEDVITTCEYRSEYVCYKNAKCERQKDGKCDWTNTPELQACLKNPPPL